jgi:hypothetical protein
METPGQWLEKALVDLCQRVETGLGLGMDTDMISGLVSYCELAHPQDAKEYLDVILSLSPTIYLMLFTWLLGFTLYYNFWVFLKIFAFIEIMMNFGVKVFFFRPANVWIIFGFIPLN